MEKFYLRNKAAIQKNKKLTGFRISTHLKTLATFKALNKSQMKFFFLAALSVLITLTTNSQSYKKLHNKAIVADTHNDILEKSIPKKLSFDDDLRGKTHSDLNRFKQGGVDVQIFSVWCDGEEPKPYALANLQIDTLYATALRNPSKIMMVKDPAELSKALKQKKLAALIGVEGGHMMEDDLNKLDKLYERGTRYMTLTWNNSTSWATSAADETKGNKPFGTTGLTDFGLKIIERMNGLGMMVDLSHVGEQTFYDAIKTTKKPVLLSHSSVYNLCPVPRNLKDDQIRAVAKNGGVIHVNFYAGFIDSNYNKNKAVFQQKHSAERDSMRKINMPDYRIDEFIAEKYSAEAEAFRPPLSMLMDHIDYIVKLVGVDYVGLGSDFDGIELAPKQLDSVADMPLITRELIARGYSKKDIRKILGGNFIRVFKANSL
jgi:membrane dipeptidase